MTHMPAPTIQPVSRFNDLGFAEQLVLWAVRHWAKIRRDEGDPRRLLTEAFTHARAAAAAPALDRLLAIINATATCTIDVRCPNCAQVSPDELRLLGAIADLQRGDGGNQAVRFLSAWLPAAAVRGAQGPAASLASALAAGGLLLRPRLAPQTTDGSSAAAAPEPLATLH